MTDAQDWPSLRAHEIRRAVTDYADEAAFFDDGNDWTDEQIAVALAIRALAAVVELDVTWTVPDSMDVVTRLQRWLDDDRRLTTDDGRGTRA